jgi:hypothetical protein
VWLRGVELGSPPIDHNELLATPGDEDASEVGRAEALRSLKDCPTSQIYDSRAAYEDLIPIKSEACGDAMMSCCGPHWR